MLQVDSIALSWLIPVFTTLVGTIVGHEYRRYREKQSAKNEEVEQWYKDCKNTVSRAIHVVNRARVRSDVTDEETMKTLESLSEDLGVKADSPPDGVTEESHDAVDVLSHLYFKATLIAEVDNKKQGEEMMEELFSLAQKEYHQDLEIKDIIEEAGGVSSSFDSFLNQAEQMGMSKTEFAGVIEDVVSDWSTEEFVDIMMEASETGNDDVDEVLNQAISLFYSLTIELSQNEYEQLEHDNPS